MITKICNTSFLQTLTPSVLHITKPFVTCLTLPVMFCEDWHSVIHCNGLWDVVQYSSQVICSLCGFLAHTSVLVGAIVIVLRLSFYHSIRQQLLKVIVCAHAMMIFDESWTQWSLNDWAIRIGKGFWVKGHLGVCRGHYAETPKSLLLLQFVFVQCWELVIMILG